MRRVALAALLLSALPSLAQIVRGTPQGVIAANRPVSLRIIPPTAMDDQQRAVWRVATINEGPDDARLFALRVSFHFRDQILIMPDACSLLYEATVQCVLDVPAESARDLVFTVRHQTVLGHHPITVERATGEREIDEAVFARPFVVTNTADSGPGSLRKAILDLNAVCARSADPCGVVFQIDGPVPEEGWFTIRPLTALPMITAPDVVVDGGTQSRHTGETNLFGGPEIVLDGSALAAGHGLHFLNGIARATDLAIGGFPGNGIESTPTVRTTVERNYLGVDGSGRTAAPNGLRGVQIGGGDMRVVDNVLSGNLRAGGFFVTGGAVDVRRNRIGEGADGTRLGNGASGIFMDKPAYTASEHMVRENVIANNAHAGIALTLRSMGIFGENTFRDNAGPAIDIGIDGDTREPLPGLAGQEGRFGAPVITSTRFENGETVIEGAVAPHPSGPYAQGVIVYAGEWSRDAAVIAVIEPQRWPDPHFTLRVPADLRGRWIRAASFMRLTYLFEYATAGTSELSEPRPVQ